MSFKQQRHVCGVRLEPVAPQTDIGRGTYGFTPWIAFPRPVGIWK
ncbi:hypothetical protein V1283_002574 [Bradyrhizobium sp. AZCC 2262]